MSLFPHLPTHDLTGITLNFEKIEALLASWGMTPNTGPVATLADLDRLQKGGGGGGGAEGKEGKEGPKGAWNPRGAWKAATAYAVNDAVTVGGATYGCIKPMTVGEDVTPPNATFWEPLAEKGATGPEGPKGTTGSEGPKGTTGSTGEYKNTGAWSAKAARTKGDTVTRNGSTFACIKTVTLAEDAEPGTAPTIWEVMAEKGATGPEGKEGPLPTVTAVAAGTRVTTLKVPSGVFTKITLDATIFDPGSHIVGGLYKASAAGYYTVSGIATVNLVKANVTCVVAIFVNEVEVLRGSLVPSPIEGVISSVVVGILELALNDKVELRVYQESGVEKSLFLGPALNRLNVSRVGEGEKGATGPEGPKGTTGSEGPKGTTGSTGEYKNTGAWSAKAARTKGDTVTRNGSTFACIKTVTLAEDAEPGTAPTIWEVMAEKGATGPEGKEGSGAAAILELIEASGTWKKPAGVSTVTVICIGGGGGGGGGAKGKAKTACTGGAGGGGGALSTWTFKASELAAEEPVTVGKGGKGGKGFEAEKAGENGEAGGESKFGSLLVALGGGAGEGGKITGIGATAGEGAIGMYAGGTGGNSNGLGEKGANVALSSFKAGAAGGASGAGVVAAETASAGGTGGGSVICGTAGGAGGAESTEGSAGKVTGVEKDGLPGTGGGGGGSSKTGAGGKGGAGGKWGAGAGGGGANITAAKLSGEGGKGAEGVILVISR